MRRRANVSSRLGLAATLALAGLVAASGGCRTRGFSEAPAPIGVGFELPGAGAVARGALVTAPPGREEAFVPFVAGGATAWVEACRAEAGGATPPAFRFETDARGAPRPSSVEAGATARDRCLAARASAASAAGLPAGTRVTVELALRGP
jgi:hypothetical protein